jgi:Mg2+ and Co2+ transporter CorA
MEPAVVMQAHVIEQSGEEQCYESIDIQELAGNLWPGRQSEWMKGCHSLRLLQDFSKRDFLIRCTHGAILVRSDFVRAMVEPARVVLIACESPVYVAFLDELRENVKAMYSAEADESVARPFNLWIVECIVCATVTLHNWRLQVLRPVVSSQLRDVEGRSPTASHMLKLYPLKTVLTRFIEQVRPMGMCLRGIVRAETEKEKEVQIRGRANSNSLIGDSTGSRSRMRANSKNSTSTQSSSVDVKSCLEDLLEPWLDNVEELMADAVELTTNIEDASRFLESAMSFLRNRLLKMELTVMVVTLALTFGALVSGIFGMNLKSGVSETDGGFFWVVAGIIVCSILIITSSYMFYGASKWAAAAHGAVYENNIFCQGVGDDDYILQLTSDFSAELGPELGSIPQTVLERILRDSRTPAPSTFDNSSLASSLPRRQPSRQLELARRGRSPRPPTSGHSATSASSTHALPLLSNTM